MEKKFHFLGVVLLLVLAAFWRLNSGKDDKTSLSATQIQPSTSLDLKNLQRHVGTLVLSDPVLSQRDKDLAGLGRKLFFDSRLSKNGRVSCATCHQPEKSFTDGMHVGHGIGLTRRNTPSIINSFAMYWFFWDGRADSLAAQALGPLEDAKEHGLARTEVVRHVLTAYKDEYETLFGKVNDSFLSELPDVAKPLRGVPLISWTLADIAAASLTHPEAIQTIASMRANTFVDFRTAFNSDIEPTESEDENAAALFDSMDEESRITLNKSFANIGLALEAFQKGIVANQSPFDKFAKSWSSGTSSEADHPDKHFSSNFGPEEFSGLQLFLGKGACDSCHSGPLFSDNQFHNIGLPLQGAHIELGRSRGVIEAKSDLFNCRGQFADYLERQAAESCKDIPYLDVETPEGLGAFKTPSLRNTAETAPYMHDGRMESLRQVLDHYNRLDSASAVGFREETLMPLGFNEGELAALEAFLKSLSSAIDDKTLL